MPRRSNSTPTRVLACVSQLPCTLFPLKKHFTCFITFSLWEFISTKPTGQSLVTGDIGYWPSQSNGQDSALSLPVLTSISGRGTKILLQATAGRDHLRSVGHTNWSLLSFSPFLNSGCWQLVSFVFLIRTSGCKVTHSSGYSRAWPGQAVSISGSPNNTDKLKVAFIQHTLSQIM